MKAADRYVIKIGQHGYYLADDREPVSTPGAALRFLTQDEAEREAQAVRDTWNLKPARGAANQVKVVIL